MKATYHLRRFTARITDFLAGGASIDALLADLTRDGGGTLPRIAVPRDGGHLPSGQIARREGDTSLIAVGRDEDNPEYYVLAVLCSTEDDCGGDADGPEPDLLFAAEELSRNDRYRPDGWWSNRQGEWQPGDDHPRYPNAAEEQAWVEQVRGDERSYTRFVVEMRREARRERRYPKRLRRSQKDLWMHVWSGVGGMPWTPNALRSHRGQRRLVDNRGGNCNGPEAE